MRVGSSEIQMGWECRDCGHLATWTTRASTAPSLASEWQLLSVMPLHAITAMYGEQGLRERFALETAQLADPAAQRQVKRALRLAARLHASDRRQREPYVNHLLRVVRPGARRCGVALAPVRRAQGLARGDSRPGTG